MFSSSPEHQYQVIDKLYLILLSLFVCLFPAVHPMNRMLCVLSLLDPVYISIYAKKNFLSSRLYTFTVRPHIQNTTHEKASLHFLSLLKVFETIFRDLLSKHVIYTVRILWHTPDLHLHFYAHIRTHIQVK